MTVISLFAKARLAHLKIQQLAIFEERLKGRRAALNALQILDEVVRRGALKPTAAVPSSDPVPSGRG